MRFAVLSSGTMDMRGHLMHAYLRAKCIRQALREAIGERIILVPLNEDDQPLACRYHHRARASALPWEPAALY